MKKNIEIIVLVISLAVFVYFGRSKLAVIYSNWGVDYSERDEYDKAINYFKISLKIDSSLPQTHYSLAEAYELKGVINEAIEEYKETIRLAPQLTDAYTALARLYLNQGMYQNAVDLLRLAENKAEDTQKIKEFGEAVIFEYLSRRLNESIDVYIAGNKTEAYSILDEVLKEDPDYKYTYCILGYFCYLDGQYADAGNYLKEAIRIDPKFWEAYRVIGDMYFQKKDYDGADNEYKKALIINSRDSNLYNELGLKFMAIERYREAVWYLERAVELAPDNINMRYSLASVYRDAHQFNNAIAKYNKVNSSQPDYPNLHNDIGDIYKNQNKNQQAVEEYQKEISYCNAKLAKNSRDVVSMTDMAYAYNQLGESDKAKLLIEEALDIRPDYRQAYLTLSKINERLGRAGDALSALNKANVLSKASYIDRDIIRIKKEFIDMTKDKVKLESEDIIYLKNGRKLKGKIKFRTQDRVVVEFITANSKGTITLRPEEIRLIIGEDAEE
ncbi:MAG: tetratricopeptide repeat protein [Candidatus Omnitrophota bacterium]